MTTNMQKLFDNLHAKERMEIRDKLNEWASSTKGHDTKIISINPYQIASEFRPDGMQITYGESGVYAVDSDGGIWKAAYPSSNHLDWEHIEGPKLRVDDSNQSRKS